MATKTDYFQTLPKEIKLRIFSYCDWREIVVNISHVCSDWMSLSKDPYLYTSLEINGYDSHELISVVLMNASLMKKLHLRTYHHPHSPFREFRYVLSKRDAFKNLRKLTLHNVYLHQNLLHLITNFCNNLNYLHMEGCRFENGLERNIGGNCSNLEVLKIINCLYTNEFLNKIFCSEFKNLTSLDLSESDINDDTMIVISKMCPQLIELNIKNIYSYNHVYESSIQSIGKNLKELEILHMRNHLVCDADIEALSDLNKLQILDIGVCQVTDAGVELLSISFNYLKELYLISCSLTNEGIKSICNNMIELRKLCIGVNEGEIFEKGIEYISHNLNKLEMLDISYSSLTNEGIKSISQNLKQIKELNISECDNVDDEGIKFLSNNLNKLEMLDISYCRRVTNEGINSISQNLNKLKELNISSCDNVDDEGIKFISDNLNKLEKLDISGSRRVTGEGIKLICSNLKKLEMLNISYCRGVTNEGINSISQNLNKLKELNIKGCMNVDDKAIRFINDNLKELKILK